MGQNTAEAMIVEEAGKAAVRWRLGRSIEQVIGRESGRNELGLLQELRWGKDLLGLCGEHGLLWRRWAKVQDAPIGRPVTVRIDRNPVFAGSRVHGGRRKTGRIDLSRPSFGLVLLQLLLLQQLLL